MNLELCNDAMVYPGLPAFPKVQYLYDSVREMYGCNMEAQLDLWL